MKEKIHVYKATGVKTNRQKDEKPQKRKFHCQMEGGNRKANIAFKHNQESIFIICIHDETRNILHMTG